MKILLTGFPTLGGSGLITTRLGIELSKLGFEVHFLFYKKPFFIRKEDNLDNVTFHEVKLEDYALFEDIGPLYSLQAASYLASIVKENNIDIIHSHYSIPHSVSSYLASKIARVKTVVTTHGSDVHTLGQTRSFNSVISLALQNTDTVTSVSKFLANETEKLFDLNNNSVKIIYDFVNTDLFRPKYEKRSLDIVQASNFRPIKQLPLLVELFGKLAPDFPEWKLKLVGDGPDRPIVNRKVRELKIRNQVEFLGVRTDIPELFAKASILGSASRIESFGLTIAEGMSCGTPVWAPNRGGIPEVCLNNKTGYLYDFDNIEEGVEKLAKLMSDDKLRSEMGKAARNHVLRNFSIEKIVQDYVKIYEELMDQKHKSIESNVIT